MRILLFFALLGLTSAITVPRAFSDPTDHGFPNPNDAQKLQLAKEAGGLLLNGPPPTSLGAASITTFQLISFNELFEIAFFSTLIANITEGKNGWEIKKSNRLLDILGHILAQEESHALAALGTLNAVGAFAPSPCEYIFPVTTLVEAINLAETFTAVVLGALQSANIIFAQEGDISPIQTVSSVIGNEAKQDGYYRMLLGRDPSESPFLTHVPAPFAFSALQAFIVPDSCPYQLSNINLTIFPPLLVNGGNPAIISPRDQTLHFSADLTGYEPASRYYGSTGFNLWLTYTTGQQLTFCVNLTNVKWDDQKLSFDADFPFSTHVMQGLSTAALTTTWVFEKANDVPTRTLAAPALIQVNDKLGPDW